MCPLPSPSPFSVLPLRSNTVNSLVCIFLDFFFLFSQDIFSFVVVIFDPTLAFLLIFN